MQFYRCVKSSLIPGNSYERVNKPARLVHNKITRKNTRRQPYVRSKYFKGDKVFVNIFWNHMAQKRRGEQIRRAKLYECAIELLINNLLPPETTVKNNRSNELLYRFRGQVNGIIFFVQVKQNKKSGRKDFMSVFPKK